MRSTLSYISWKGQISTEHWFLSIFSFFFPIVIETFLTVELGKWGAWYAFKSVHLINSSNSLLLNKSKEESGLFRLPWEVKASCYNGESCPLMGSQVLIFRYSYSQIAIKKIDKKQVVPFLLWFIYFCLLLFFFNFFLIYYIFF